MSRQSEVVDPMPGSMCGHMHGDRAMLQLWTRERVLSNGEPALDHAYVCPKGGMLLEGHRAGRPRRVVLSRSRAVKSGP